MSVISTSEPCSVESMRAKLVSREAHQTFVDVRTSGEFKSSRIEGVENIPLSELERHISKLNQFEEIYVSCHNGMRTRQAVQKLQSRGLNAIAVEGGIVAWRKAGYPIQQAQGFNLSLQRQVQIIVGSLIIMGTGLGLLIDIRFVWVALVMGAGLLYTGLSGSCMMAMMLEHMPWNRA